MVVFWFIEMGMAEFQFLSQYNPQKCFSAVNKFALSLSPLKETEFARELVSKIEWYEELLQ